MDTVAKEDIQKLEIPEIRKPVKSLYIMIHFLIQQ